MKATSIGMLWMSLALSATALANPWWIRGSAANEADFLPPDQAFRVSAVIDGPLLRVRWVIADGYYLYRSRMEIQAESPDLRLAAPVFPRGIVKIDPFLGTQETYEQQVDAAVAYARVDYGAHPIELKVTYQGCAKAGLCYPPISKILAPRAAPPAAAPVPHPWEGSAIIGGVLAFLIAGLVLRKGRKLDMPVA